MGELGHMFKGYELGAVDYLIKPIDPVILRSKVLTFCELYAQRTEIEYRKANLEVQVSERTAELSSLAERLQEEIKVRQAAEEALREHEARMREVLEQRIEERTRELKTATEQLVESEKLALLARVVAGVAHELNTPIGNIVTIASTLEERIKEIGKSVRAGTLTKHALETAVEECADASVMIVRSSQHAGELVDSFKKVAVDTASQRRRKFDLRDTMADIVNTLGTMMRHAHVTSDLQIPPGIQMDSFPGYLEQIFSNLIINSIHHGFEDRGSGHIQITGRVLKDSVEIVYRDDGIGIAPEFHHKVFEPFYTTKLGQGGSGLGMFIVFNLTHAALKGDIRLESAVGEGLTLTLTMPVVTPTEL
jgi:signal transduction histidine kinase